MEPLQGAPVPRPLPFRRRIEILDAGSRTGGDRHDESVSCTPTTRPGDLGRNEPRQFLRLPVAGEHLAREVKGPWYDVTLVVHCPSPFDGDYAAEVDARKVDSAKVLRRSGPWKKGPGLVV